MSSKIRRKRISSTWITLVVLVLGAAWGHAGPSATADTLPSRDEEVNRIRLLWQQQSNEIVSGKFEVILFRYSDSSAKLLSRAEAIRRLKSIGNSASPLSVEPLFDDVAQRGWKKEQSNLWGTPIDVTIDGSKIANSYWKAKGKSVRVYDGESEIDYRAVNRQASITAGRSWVHQVDIATIHVVPNHRVASEKSTTLEPLDEGRNAILRSGGATVWFDRASGFVHQLTVSGHEGVIHEVLQFGPTEVEGITLAKTVAELNIENDNVRMMSIYLINPISINKAIPDEAFRVDVPANTVIRDYRKDAKSPDVVRVPQQLSDVKRYREMVPERPR